MFKKPHKHAEVIKAWADNPTNKLQFRYPSTGRLNHDWVDIKPSEVIYWYEDLEYRIKPEPKPDMELYTNLVIVPPIQGLETDDEVIISGQTTYYKRDNCNIKVTVDRETLKLKSVELIK